MLGLWVSIIFVSSLKAAQLILGRIRYEQFQQYLKATLVILSLLVITSCAEGTAEQEKWYSVEFESLCDKSDHMTSSYQDEITHGRYKPYDFVTFDTLQTVEVSFKFIAECCLKFTGAANLKEDTLKLTYWDTKGSAPCDCMCDYKMTYNLNKNKGTWKKVTVQLKEVDEN